MASIYSQAFVTIIAASGKDANSGLPSIQPGSRATRSQITEEVKPGVHLMVVKENSMVWDPAAWSVYRQVIFSKLDHCFSVLRLF